MYVWWEHCVWWLKYTLVDGVENCSANKFVSLHRILIERWNRFHSFQHLALPRYTHREWVTWESTHKHSLLTFSRKNMPVICRNKISRAWRDSKVNVGELIERWPKFSSSCSSVRYDQHLWQLSLNQLEYNTALKSSSASHLTYFYCHRSISYHDKFPRTCIVELESSELIWKRSREAGSSSGKERSKEHSFCIDRARLHTHGCAVNLWSLPESYNLLCYGF